MLKEILRERKWQVEDLRLWQGRGMPDPTPSHLLILMGGPMSVNEEDVYPFLSEEKAFLRQWIGGGNPTLGICLGAQLIADVLGGRVYKGHSEEIGWYEVTLSEEGKRDPHLHFFPSTFPVFQWHSETFDLPDGAALLATSQDYPHQAFRFGDLTYAFQFHLEMTESMIRRWLEESEVQNAKKHGILSFMPFQLSLITQLCGRFLRSFVELIEIKAGKSACGFSP